jgi:IS605 OrfB family transposase
MATERLQPPTQPRIVNQFDLLAVADLSVNHMMHHQCLANSIQDAAWRQFAALLAYTAAGAGREYGAVNPAYTSQDGSRCGHRQALSLADRLYTCPCGGLVLDRDRNASRNILRLGQQSLASAEKPPDVSRGVVTIPWHCFNTWLTKACSNVMHEFHETSVG